MLKRLDQIVAQAGQVSRSDAKKMIRQNRIAVNGRSATDPACKADPEAVTITLDGLALHWREWVYLMMNKPSGLVSATTDSKDSTVCSLLRPEHAYFAPAPVGRLDKDTEGLVLLTNDGTLAHRVISPKSHVPKTYYAHIAGTIPQELPDTFQEGVTLDDGYRTLPAELEIIGQSGDGWEYEILLTIYEGKFHQVKRMFAAFGLPVTYLKRLSIGPLELDPVLKLGEYRELTEEEVATLKKAVT